MTFEQITTLLDRGFTPEQITMLTNSGDPTSSEQAAPGGDSNPLESPPETADNKGSETPPEEPKPAEEPPAATPDSNAAVLDAIADLKKSIQASNIKTMSVDSVDADNALEKAMSEIIRPSLEKGE